MIPLRSLARNSAKDRFFPSKPSFFPIKAPVFHIATVENPNNDRFSPPKPPYSSKNRVLWPISFKDRFLIGLRGFCSENTSSQPAYRLPSVISKAQSALFEYLHGTSGLDFLDAEHMSKNSPVFLNKILNRMKKGEDGTGRALSRFLRYHPPNEFELFFESIGLKPSEFDPFLPRNLMYLKDVPDMLDNFHVLCNYGIARDKIGNIYKEAAEVFGYKRGVLNSKLGAYQELGLSKCTVIRIVPSSPCLLLGDVDRAFVKVLEELEDIGIPRDWIGSFLSENTFYRWERMPILLHSCLGMGFGKQELGALLRKHPDFLLDGSGKTVTSLVGLLLKVGASRDEILGLLTEFPPVQVGSFMNNLRRGLLFFIEIEMEPQGIQKIFRSHLKFIGLNILKKPNSLFTELCIGRKRLCRIIEEDPDQLMKYVRGSKLIRLPNSGDDERSLMQKIDFLLSLGLVEGSEEMNRVLKQCRGKGDELRERFEFLVKCGLHPTDVSSMIRRSPHVLNQKMDVLERKISFLVNELGFPLNSLVAFPQYMSFTVGRVKLRFSMYNWLKDGGNIPSLALSTVLACSDKKFKKRFIDSHPQGPEMWGKFMKSISPQVD